MKNGYRYRPPRSTSKYFAITYGYKFTKKAWAARKKARKFALRMKKQNMRG